MPIKVNSEKIFDFGWAKVFFTINLHNAHDSTTYLYDIGNNKKNQCKISIFTIFNTNGTCGFLLIWFTCKTFFGHV